MAGETLCDGGVPNFSPLSTIYLDLSEEQNQQW